MVTSNTGQNIFGISVISSFFKICEKDDFGPVKMSSDISIWEGFLDFKAIFSALLEHF